MNNGCLLLNIAGPMQSYCLDPKTNTAFKRTLPHPTKSFVAGLICNAMGYDRDGMMDNDILSEISNLKTRVGQIAPETFIRKLR